MRDGSRNLQGEYDALLNLENLLIAIRKDLGHNNDNKLVKHAFIKIIVKPEDYDIIDNLPTNAK